MHIHQYQQASELWLQFRDALHGYLLKRTKDTALAEEINQQVLVKTLNSCCSGRKINNTRSWLFQVAHNTWVDHLKQSDKFDMLPQASCTEASKGIYQSLAEYLEPLISFLPEKYAIPLILSDLEGMKQEEIAQKLGLSLSGAKSRVQRARQLLKAEIKTCFYLDEAANGLEGFALKQSCTPLQNFVKEKTE